VLGNRWERRQPLHGDCARQVLGMVVSRCQHSRSTWDEPPSWLDLGTAHGCLGTLGGVTLLHHTIGWYYRASEGIIQLDGTKTDWRSMMVKARTYSVSDAARALGIGEQSVYDAIREGRLPALRVGRKPKLRVPRVAVEELLRHPERWQRSAG